MRGPVDSGLRRVIRQEADEIEADYGGDPHVLAAGLERHARAYDHGRDMARLVAAELRRRARARALRRRRAEPRVVLIPVRERTG